MYITVLLSVLTTLYPIASSDFGTPLPWVQFLTQVSPLASGYLIIDHILFSNTSKRVLLITSVIESMGTAPSDSTSNKRVFPPLYVTTGNVSRDRLAFIHILERLKV